jgi:pyruvate,water dikinase
MNEKGTSRLQDGLVARISEAGGRSRVCGTFKLLALLGNKGFKVPAAVVCSFDAHRLYMENPSEALDTVRKRLSELLTESEGYSVRSCTSPEDSYDFSFLGQPRKHFNIRGVDAILGALKDNWESASTGMAIHDKKPYEKRPLMSAMIQKTPNVKLSGVVFTCNPVTGVDEVVVEVSNQGLYSFTGQDSSPSRWVFKRGELTQRPDNQEDSDEIVREVVKTAVKIAGAFSSSVALEWVFDGSQICWLQIGLVSKIGRTNVYSNRISREFLPGIIKPLVWSVNIPVVNSSWKALFKELIGPMADGIDINSLARSFYYRAYFNMGVVGDIFDLLGIPRESLEILSGVETQDEKRSRFRPGAKALQFVPRMLLFALKKLVYSKQIECFLRKKTTQYASLARIDLSFLDAKKCLAAIDELFKLNTESSYVVIVTQLLNGLYNMILQRHLKRLGIDAGRISFGEASERLRSVDPRYDLSSLSSLYAELPRDLAERISVMAYPNIIDDPNCCGFGTRLSLFVRRFGHLSDSGNDFSTPAWREDPHLLVNMITQYKPSRYPSQPSSDQSLLENSLKKNIFTRLFYARAVKYREYRTAVTFVYSIGYWCFRRYFLRIAEIWVSEGYTEFKDDIFYLNFEEIRALVEEKVSPLELRKRILKRKSEVERYREIALPDIIYDDLPKGALVNATARKEFLGVPTSRGHYIGPARLVRGVRDFDKIQHGDVLIISHSDISWTPVFSKARAVVSESGGILSHCSIVAREYAIPAVVSVKGALTIKDGVRIAVDGYKGIVRVLTE